MKQSKDRTNEFKMMVSSMSSNGVSVDKKQTKNQQNYKTVLSINKLASTIAHDIFVTSSKLEELTKLAKSNSPFGKGEKIDELKYQIKSDLKTIQNKLEQLDTMVKSQKIDGNSQQIKNHSETVVHTLQSNLVNTSKIFTDALEIRAKNEKYQEERREKLTGTRRTTPSPVFQPDFDMYDDNSEEGDGEISISVPLMETNDDLIITRVSAVQHIEEEIKKIREMFQKLAMTVAIQNDSILRIEDNIQDVYVNVNQAQNNLLTYLQKVVSNRSFIIKIFFILAFFIFLFFMFFV